MNASAERLHEEVERRLATSGQRYTDGRRQLVDALAAAKGPLSVPDLLRVVADMPQSSAYRHLTVLAATGVAHRIAAADDQGFFELSDEMGNDHHHHVLCGTCGAVADVASSPKIEKVLLEAASLAAADTGYEIDAHRIDLIGTCPKCSKAADR